MTPLAPFLLALTLVVGGLVAARPAAATPSQEVVRARAEFDRGEYANVVKTLVPQLYPRLLIRDEEELEEAHYLLAEAYFFLGERDLARQEFTALLFLDPTRELDPVTESPAVYAFFVTLKRELRDKLQDLERQKRIDAERRKRPSRRVVIERTIHERSPWLNFVPLGAGQFQNGDRKKGIFFLSAQLALAGASLGTLAAQALQYGIPMRYDGTDAEEVADVRTLQVVQLGTGGLFWIVYAWGVIDAFANQKPAVEEHRREEPIPQESSLRVAPIPVPQGAGIGATWRF